MRREISPSELSFFYQKIGEAIWQLQYVEDTLINLYFIKVYAKCPNGIQEVEANKILKKLQKNTLGQLIGLVEKASIIPIELLKLLKEFNTNRKWVVHNSMRNDGDELYTSRGRSKFVERVLNFTETSMEIHKSLEQEVLEHGEKNGLSIAAIYEMAENQINELKGNV